MDTIFMKSEKNKTFDPHRLAEKIDSKRSDKLITLSNLSIYSTWKYMKKVI